MQTASANVFVTIMPKHLAAGTSHKLQPAHAHHSHTPPVRAQLHIIPNAGLSQVSTSTKVHKVQCSLHFADPTQSTCLNQQVCQSRERSFNSFNCYDSDTSPKQPASISTGSLCMVLHQPPPPASCWFSTTKGGGKHNQCRELLDPCSSLLRHCVAAPLARACCPSIGMRRAASSRSSSGVLV